MVQFKKTVRKNRLVSGFFGPILVRELSNLRVLVQHHPYNLASLRQPLLRHPRLCVQIESDAAAGVAQQLLHDFHILIVLS